MTENHFRSHFAPFQINRQLFFSQNGCQAVILDDRKSFLITFLAISDQYANFGQNPICAKNNRVLPLCVINGYAKYEVDR